MLKNLSPDQSRAEFVEKTVQTRKRYRDTATEDKPFFTELCAATRLAFGEPRRTSAKQRAKR
ncbi:MAG: hypothetical protein Q8P16_00595, partial [bacterium]|nr:hypothetical protein [bacterium]